LEALAADLEHGAAREHDDPLVLLLDVVAGLLEATAQDLLDDGVLEGEHLLERLAGGGRLGRVAEPSAPVRGHRATVEHPVRVGTSSRRSGSIPPVPCLTRMPG